MAATDAIGFVMEASAKIASGVIGALLFGSPHRAT